MLFVQSTSRTQKTDVVPHPRTPHVVAVPHASWPFPRCYVSIGNASGDESLGCDEGSLVPRKERYTRSLDTHAVTAWGS